MSDVFDQFDRAVLGQHVPGFGSHPACLPASGAVDLAWSVGGDLSDTALLHHLAESLSDAMSMRLDLIVMRCARALLNALNLGTEFRCLLKNFGKFLFQVRLFRIHAISFGGYRVRFTPPSLSQEAGILLLTFSTMQSDRKS
jgi:hypothetical protein